MIIKEVTIKNFRSYYGVNTIKFNDGLMIFIGDNGDGKTTFFEALEWLFDTSTQNCDFRLISEKRISELPEFENDTVSVSMIFDHDGEKIVDKSFSFTKNSNSEIRTSDFQFKGYQNEGSQRIPIQGGTLLDRCFEAGIRKYCLFKGEENLNVFNKPEALSYLIETFSTIKKFDPYYSTDEDQSGFTDFAEHHSRKAFQKAMKSDKNNSQQEKILSIKLDDLRTDLQKIRQRLKNNRANASSYTTKLNELENNKEASDLLKGINERLKSLKEKKNKMESHIDEDYSIKLLDDLWILCGFSTILSEFQKKVSTFSKAKRKLEREEDKIKGKRELVKEISRGIIPLSPNIPDKFSMEEMINDEFCKVCGREAQEGSPAYNFMKQKLTDLINSQQPTVKDEENPLFQNDYVKELERKSNNLEYDQLEINALQNTIRERIEFNNARKVDANDIQERINIEEENKKKLLAQNDRLTEEQLQNAYENIKNWWDYKNQAEKEIVLLEKYETEKVTELEEVQEQYNNLAKGSIADTSRKIHSALDRIKKAFKHAQEKNTQDFLEQLEDRSNIYLEKLNVDGFYGIIRVIKSNDNTVQIALEDSNGRLISNPNQKLKTTMYMSVLFAVSDLTAIKRENDYPLIFDAPTSSFSAKNEIDFFNVISGINKQCIIVTKSFLNVNGELDNHKIEQQNGTIYRMEKAKPFNEKDLSTIETKLILIKG